MQHTGRARVNPRHPEAFGVCDRCGFWNQLNSLGYQHEWRGARVEGGGFQHGTEILGGRVSSGNVAS